jgi:FAD/FMN-containing dehydrogenase
MILFKTDLGVDLFAALKGGGNNFGIVTAYTLQTHPQDHKVNRVQLY